MALPPVTDEDPRPPPRVCDQIRRIWARTDEESIHADLEKVRKLAAEAGPDEKRLARSYVRAMERLERWLHDL